MQKKEWRSPEKLASLCYLIMHEKGPRVYIAKKRIHHGGSGIVLSLLAIKTKKWPLLLPGILACLHDRHDFPWNPWEEFPLI